MDLSRASKVLCATLLFLGSLWFAVPASAAGCDMQFPVPNATNQTTALQTVIDAAPDGTPGDRTVLCFPTRKGVAGYSYRVEGALSLVGRNHIQVLGRNASIHRTALVGDIDPTSRTAYLPQIAIQSSHDIAVDGLTTTSVGTCSFNRAYEGEAAVQVNGSTDISLTALTIAGPGGDGYSLGWYQVPGSQTPGTPSERIHISGGSVTCAGRQGVAISSSTFDSSVEGVTFDRPARSVLNLEMAGQDSALLIDGLTFQNNIALNVKLNFVAGGGAGIQRNVFILDNTVTTLNGKYGDADSVVDRYNIVFDGNTATTPWAGLGPLLSFKGVDGVTVSNNSQPNGSVVFTMCTNASQSGNSW
jgi:hypothetical protein